MLSETETLEHAYAAPINELVQASTGKRFANYIIDLLFFYMVLIFWVLIASLVSPATIEAMDDDNVFGSFLDRIIGLIAYAVIMSFIEATFRGKSIGKFITGTKAVNADGSDLTFGKAFERGFSRAIPLNAFSALGRPCYPWHDKWTNTYVIDEKETQHHNEQLRSS